MGMARSCWGHPRGSWGARGSRWHEASSFLPSLEKSLHPPQALRVLAEVPVLAFLPAKRTLSLFPGRRWEAGGAPGWQRGSWRPSVGNARRAEACGIPACLQCLGLCPRSRRVFCQGEAAWLTSLCGVTSAAPVGGGEGLKFGGKTPFFAVGSLGGAGVCLKKKSGCPCGESFPSYIYGKWVL